MKKNIIVYYASEWTKCLLTIKRMEEVKYFVDDDFAGEKLSFFNNDVNYPIFLTEKLKEEKKGQVVIIVSDNKRYQKAKKRLEELGFRENKDFYNGWKLDKVFYKIKELNDDWESYEKDNNINYEDYYSWDWRAKKLFSLITTDVKSIMDVGCGNCRLKNYLNDDIVYYGLDYTRRDENTIVCDLNKDSLPKLKVDLYYMAGVIYYVDDLERLFSQMRDCKYLIFDFYDEANYLRLDGHYADINTPVLNKRKGYLTFVELLNALAANGFMIEQGIYDFEKSYAYYFRAKNIERK